jgi:hypothetical protein
MYKNVSSAINYAKEVCITNDGKTILNCNFGGQYAIKFDNNSYLVMSLDGREYNFSMFDKACLFITAANTIETKLINELYSNLKS